MVPLISLSIVVMAWTGFSTANASAPRVEKVTTMINGQSCTAKPVEHLSHVVRLFPWVWICLDCTAEVLNRTVSGLQQVNCQRILMLLQRISAVTIFVLTSPSMTGPARTSPGHYGSTGRNLYDWGAYRSSSHGRDSHRGDAPTYCPCGTWYHIPSDPTDVGVGYAVVIS
jgi:hypothetical protein